MKLPVGATIASLIAVAILIGLGAWQFQRLHWKNDIIARLDAAYAMPASTDTDSRVLETLSKEDAPIAYGAVSGHFLREKALLLGPRTEHGRIGYHLVVPIVLAEGGKTLLVNTGWVSDLWKDTLEERLAALPDDQETVRTTGIIHKPDWTSFTSKNSPANDLWFRADIAEITKAKDLKNVYPFMLYADAVTPSLNDVDLHESRWYPRNKHLQYAIFWLSMAAVLTGIYIAYVMKRDR